MIISTPAPAAALRIVGASAKGRRLDRRWIQRAIHRVRPRLIPEALSPNDLTLPSGAECDKCNHYFGRKPEPNLCHYPGVAFALQFWGIHGKKELRKRLSTIERTDEGKTQASGHSLKIETDKEGRRTIYLDLPTDPSAQPHYTEKGRREVVLFQLLNNLRRPSVRRWHLRYGCPQGGPQASGV